MAIIPNYVETSHCLNCKRAFFRLKKEALRKRLPDGVRRRDCKTCSPECSREYCRLQKAKRKGLKDADTKSK